MLRIAALVFLFASLARAADQPKPILEDWKDAKRDRVVPVKIYLPADSDKPAPIVIFSHGLGGTRENYQYLGEHWSAQGYVVVHMQHIGSDDSVWKPLRAAGGADTRPNADGRPGPAIMESMRKAANADNYLARIKDTAFVIDELERQNKDGPLMGKLDLDRIAFAGHSFGAQTAQAEAGQVSAVGNLSGRDPRIKVVIAMSPAPPEMDRAGEKVFAKIAVPVFYLTGTEDRDPFSRHEPAERKIPYEKANAKDQYQLVFEGGDHMLFSGNRLALKKPHDDAYRATILKTTTAFLDAYLRNDDKAKAWLREKAKDEIKDQGTFEWK
jgi:predicted dienelactone hydrolase